MKVLALLCTVATSLLIQNVTFVAALPQDSGVTRSTYTGVETVTRITGGDTSTIYTTSTSPTKTKTTTTTSKPYSTSTTKSSTSIKPTTTKYSTSTKPTTTKPVTTKPTTTKSTTSSYTTSTQCVVAPYGQCGGLTYKGCINCPLGYWCNPADPYRHECDPIF